MNFSSSKSLPVYFWIVSGIALLWHSFGVYSYFIQTTVNADHSEHIRYEGLPFWYMSISAIAVFAGLLGAIFCLLRKKMAYTLFIVSFLAVGIQQFYVLTEINPRDIFLPLTSIVIVVFLIWFSKRSIARQWLK